ncbi:hypothetical protein H4R99_001292 [Coemansia sp. RSA 1722]|nr:hypothetical protein IWW45_001372 [Coemansia sp. RSA 485]KAJ2605244.1 hypothetical protein H4R99_001292 [Coemansia sp. RSA 1722]KAJ2703907.1 hypothetical protein FB645_003727 [Coemansia sp. IMI 203386]
MSSERVYADFSSLVGTKAKSSSKSALVDPHGFDASIASSTATSSFSSHKNDHSDMELRAKKAWEVAMGPAKTLPMQAFMAWMSGTGVSIFSILITGMILMTPFKTIMSVQKTFAPLERVAKGSSQKLDLTMQKAAFIAINVAGILFGIYRLSIMGLLPTASSDWLAFIPAKAYSELSF